MKKLILIFMLMASSIFAKDVKVQTNAGEKVISVPETALELEAAFIEMCILYIEESADADELENNLKEMLDMIRIAKKEILTQRYLIKKLSKARPLGFFANGGFLIDLEKTPSFNTNFGLVLFNRVNVGVLINFPKFEIGLMGGVTF
ncbi:MAG: hypothetical protein GF311_28205 [Candidatus Lokiarchaeota archaeon]|nr:hypothetical protein [Candidatus Lokiarchaeota archaeon]